MTNTAAPAFDSGNVDDVVSAQMQEYRIPGLSLAVIKDGEIIQAQGYGFTDRNGQTPVTEYTLFQAASVSKPVAAAGALRLVELGKLALDEDVNAKLQMWKVPENEFTAQEKVTLRRILSHRAGLTIHGFRGYALGKPLPTVVQVLNGEPPANSSPVRVDVVPGGAYRYSGGGYTVMQQLMMDVTGRTFAEWMRQFVLAPFGMTSSAFAPRPEDILVSSAATGHLPDGTALPGRWHTYPEMAAAGLWSTTSDLARFVIGIQQSLAGKANPVISPPMTREMLTPQVNGVGLGFALNGEGITQRFMHSGRNQGFDAFMVAFAEIGRGAAIMVNANVDPKVISTIVKAISKEHWSRAK